MSVPAIDGRNTTPFAIREDTFEHNPASVVSTPLSLIEWDAPWDAPRRRVYAYYSSLSSRDRVGVPQKSGRTRAEVRGKRQG